MALDVSTLDQGYVSYSITDDGVTYAIWTAEAHGVRIGYETFDVDALFYVSPIWNMRQKGVSLVDQHGVMVKNERRDR